MNRNDDWLSRREAVAHNRGIEHQKRTNSAKDDAFDEVMALLGCDGNTQFSKVPDMIRKLLEAVNG